MRFLIALFLFLFIITPTPTHAETDFERLAQFMPADVDFFAVTRIDSDFVNRLDTLFSTANTHLPNALSQSISVNRIINQIVASPIELNFVQLLDEILGDWVGIGVDGVTEFISNTNSDMVLYLVFSIENNQPIQSLLPILLNSLQLEARNPIGEYQIYDNDTLTLALSPSSLYISVNAPAPIYITNPLSASAMFAEAAHQLPETNYDVWAYFNTLNIFSEMTQNIVIQRVLASFDINNTTTGVSTLGIRLDTNALSVDLVQHFDIPQTRTYRPITTSFCRFIPPQAQFFIHTTDFSGFFEGAIGAIAPILSASETRESLMNDVGGFAQLLLNVNLQEDILNWNTGDFAFWGRFLSESQQSPYFGWVFRTTTRNQSETLVRLLAQAAQDNWGATSVNSIQINNTAVAFIQLPTQVQQSLSSEIAIGANEDIFFIATPAAAQDLLTRHDGYCHTNSPVQATFLESPKVVFYLDRNSVGEMGILLTTLLEPVELFLFGDPLSPEMMQAYRTAFAQLFPALSVSAKASEQGDVIIRLVAQINTLLEVDIPSE